MVKLELENLATGVVTYDERVNSGREFECGSDDEALNCVEEWINLKTCVYDVLCEWVRLNPSKNRIEYLPNIKYFLGVYRKENDLEEVGEVGGVLIREVAARNFSDYFR